MDREKLDQIHLTLAFLKSVIMSGESYTEEVHKASEKALENIQELKNKST